MIKVKKTAALALSAVIALSAAALTACGSSESDNGNEHITSPEEITLSIDFPKSADEDDVTDKEIKVEKKSSAYDAIQLYSYVSELTIYANVTDGNIIGIGSVMNGYGGKKNRWVLYKNGEKVTDKNDSEVSLSSGDKLKWVYQINKKSNSKSTKNSSNS